MATDRMVNTHTQWRLKEEKNIPFPRMSEHASVRHMAGDIAYVSMCGCSLKRKKRKKIENRIFFPTNRMVERRMDENGPSEVHLKAYKTRVRVLYANRNNNSQFSENEK